MNRIRSYKLLKKTEFASVVSVSVPSVPLDLLKRNIHLFTHSISIRANECVSKIDISLKLLYNLETYLLIMIIP